MQYDYDAAKTPMTGNAMSIQDYVAGNPQEQDFSYDLYNRLTSAMPPAAQAELTRSNITIMMRTPGCYPAKPG